MAFGILDLANGNDDVAVLNGRMFSGMQYRDLAVTQISPAMLQGIEEALEAVVDISSPFVRREHVDVDPQGEVVSPQTGGEKATCLEPCGHPLNDLPHGPRRVGRVASISPNRLLGQPTKKRPTVANVGRADGRCCGRYALATNLPRSVF